MPAVARPVCLALPSRLAAGGILLTGVLAYFLYYGASLGLGTAYNRLFLVYIALFSASFYAFILAFTAFDLGSLAERISPHFPRRGAAIFMIVVGLGLALIWLSDRWVPRSQIARPQGWVRTPRL